MSLEVLVSPSIDIWLSPSHQLVRSATKFEEAEGHQTNRRRILAPVAHICNKIEEIGGIVRQAHPTSGSDLREKLIH